MERSPYLAEVTQEIEDRTPEGFERYVGALLEGCGWPTEVTPFVGDYGADVITTSPAGTKYAIQVKHQRGSLVGIEAVQQVIGALAYYKAHKAIVITSGRGYTQSALELADKNAVVLWTLHHLAKVMMAVRTSAELPALEAIGLAEPPAQETNALKRVPHMMPLFGKK